MIITFNENTGALVGYVSDNDENLFRYIDKSQGIDAILHSIPLNPRQMAYRMNLVSRTIDESSETRPSKYHEWSWDRMIWEDARTDVARSDVKIKVSSERSKTSLLPCNDFDANTQARTNISGTIARLARGDGLPEGWVGWRDAKNEMHWITNDATIALEGLSALARAIEDRDQALFVRMWQKKAEIDALQTLEEILSYDTSL